MLNLFIYLFIYFILDNIQVHWVQQPNYLCLNVRYILHLPVFEAIFDIKKYIGNLNKNII